MHLLKICILFWSVAFVQHSNFAQSKADYQWVVGYSSSPVRPDFGNTLFDFGKDTVAYIKYESEANFYLTNASIADEDGNLLLYTNGCAIYNSDHEIIVNGDDINPGMISERRCPSRGYSVPHGA